MFGLSSCVYVLHTYILLPIPLRAHTAAGTYICSLCAVQRQAFGFYATLTLTVIVYILLPTRVYLLVRLLN